MDLCAILAQYNISGPLVCLPGKSLAAIIANVRATGGQDGQKQQRAEQYNEFFHENRSFLFLFVSFFTTSRGRAVPRHRVKTKTLCRIKSYTAQKANGRGRTFMEQQQNPPL